MSAISSFKNIENKHDVSRGDDCMKKFCDSLRQHRIKKIIFFKKIKLLTKEQHIKMQKSVKFVRYL